MTIVNERTRACRLLRKHGEAMALVMAMHYPEDPRTVVLVEATGPMAAGMGAQPIDLADPVARVAYLESGKLSRYCHAHGATGVARALLRSRPVGVVCVVAIVGRIAHAMFVDTNVIMTRDDDENMGAV